MTGRARYSSEQLLAHLRRALGGESTLSDGDIARLDYDRATRVGVPEIILAESKPDDRVLKLTERMLARSTRVLVSRVSDDLVNELERRFQEFNVERPDGSNVVRVSTVDSEKPDRGGRVAILTAGTSDLPLAHETRLVAEEMGCKVRIWADVGVAGLHRLVQPFREAIDDDAGVIVVVAGMDGALPSVVSGLSPIPVIGLPSSVGYGYGGNGEAALMSMLQTCAPGLTVVNIDNSVGAGIAAARIANLDAIPRQQ